MQCNHGSQYQNQPCQNWHFRDEVHKGKYNGSLQGGGVETLDSVYGNNDNVGDWRSRVAAGAAS